MDDSGTTDRPGAAAVARRRRASCHGVLGVALSAAALAGRAGSVSSGGPVAPSVTPVDVVRPSGGTVGLPIDRTGRIDQRGSGTGAVGPPPEGGDGSRFHPPGRVLPGGGKIDAAGRVLFAVVSAASAASREDLRAGVAYGVAAYGIWGLVPLYFKAVAEVAPLEVLAHRVVWSVVLLLPLTRLRGQWPTLRAAVADRRGLAVLALTTVLIATNWFVFILAVDTGRVLEASLGYFINPLVNVLLGMVFLGERLSRPAAAAVGLAGLGVAVQAAVVGAVPWIALILASSFGLYGLLRKTAVVGSVVGLTVETTLLAPAAFGFLLWSGRTGDLAFGAGTPQLSGLLALAGVVTAVPLLAFTSAARRLRLATLGFLQYLSPSGHFLLAVLVFGEPLDTLRLASFGCIWAALGVFTADQLRGARA